MQSQRLRWPSVISTVVVCSLGPASAGRQTWRNFPYKSQFSQDRWLVEHAFRYRPQGFYVEAGSNDGISASNTYALEYGMGWTGLLIEANPELYKDCRRNRPQSTCLPGCISNVTGNASFVVDGLLSHLENARQDSKQELQRIAVNCKPMSAWLAENNAPRDIDYLSLDIENHEADVLPALLADRRYNIDILTVETFIGLRDPDEILNLLRYHNYFYIAKLGVDAVFFRSYSAEGCSGWSERSLWSILGTSDPSMAHWLAKAWYHEDMESLGNVSRRLPHSLYRRLQKSGCIAGAYSVRLARLFVIDDLRLKARSGGNFVEVDIQALHKRSSSKYTWTWESFFPVPPLLHDLVRLDFKSVLISDWPVFCLVGLFGQAIQTAKFEGDLSTFDCSRLDYEDGSSDQDFRRFGGGVSLEALSPWFEVCGGLRKVVSLLKEAQKDVFKQPDPRTTLQGKAQPWAKPLLLAETLLKGLMVKYTPPSVIKSASQHDPDSNPWVLLHRLQLSFRKE